MSARGFAGSTDEFELEGTERTGNGNGNALVPIGGKLPHKFEVRTGKLLDVIMALSPRNQNLQGKQRQKAKQKLNQRIYAKTRPGFYFEAGEHFHFSYAGQPEGAGSQHHWRIFCTDTLKSQIEAVLAGTSLVASPPPNASNGSNGSGGNYQTEWGGLYLRSEAEIRIAQALDHTGLLFFANARGRVGLQHTAISDRQLTGRVETDFMVFYQGRCFALEVDGSHHLENDQMIRDYARDRVLLRAGVPTVRFTAKDCLDDPQSVVSEFLSIIMQKETLRP